MKTTKKHFKLFKQECKYWLKRFNVTGVTYCYIQLSKGVYAAYGADIIYFSNTWSNKIKLTDKNIKMVAKHEAIHALLHEISDFAISGAYSEKIYHKAEEALVRKLNKLIK